jgi:hypothetical protein
MQNTLETGEEDAKYTRDEWIRCKNTLERSVEDAKVHSKRVEKKPSTCLGGLYTDDDQGNKLCFIAKSIAINTRP